MTVAVERVATRRPLGLRLATLGVAITLPLVIAHVAAPDVAWLRRLELHALDVQMRVRGVRAAGPETVIVMIDDATIAALGRWPVPRATLAEVVTRLHEAGARTIGIDILFADPESFDSDGASGDTALGNAIRSAGNVVLPYAFRFGVPDVKTKGVVPPSPYAHLQQAPEHRPLALQPTGVVLPTAALGTWALLGHILVAYDVDGAARYDYPALEFDVDYYPSMAVRVAQHFLRVPWDAVTIDLGRGIRLGETPIPTDASLRLLVDYLGPTPAFPTYRLSDVLGGTVPASAFTDRIVLIGSNALGTRDTFKTPFTAVMPGVERLATVVDGIVQRRHLQRPVGMTALEATAMTGAAAMLGLGVARLPLAHASLLAALLVAGWAGAAQLMLARFGVWQASAVPIVAVVVTFLGLALYRYGLLDKERRHIRRVFERYLAPAMVERVVASARAPQLGGEQRELTILFCDLRGFTGLSERLDPGALTRLVNDFLQAATDAILEHGGTVDKYVGDAIMAFWNAPLDEPRHALLACRAALSIRRRLRERNEAAVEHGLTPLDAGIGINTGVCTVGNFGSSHRFDYSAIGDAVNIAARLESETRALGVPILLGAQTAARIRDSGLTTVAVGSVQLRGRRESLEVFSLMEEPSASRTR